MYTCKGYFSKALSIVLQMCFKFATSIDVLFQSISFSYHAACLDEWLRVSELCPLCKTSVLPSSDSALTAIAVSPAQSIDNVEPSLTEVNEQDTDDAEVGNSRLPDDALSSPSPHESSAPERNSATAVPSPPPLPSQTPQSPSSPPRSRRFSRVQRGTSLDDTMEMVPVSPQSSSHTSQQFSSSSPRQVHPQIIPAERERERDRGRAWSGRVAPSEDPLTNSPQHTPRRQPPSRTTRQPHRREV